MSTTDVVRWGHGLGLPPGWFVRGISVSQPYPTMGFRFDNDEATELEVTFMNQSGAEVEMVFMKGGFDPEWLYDYLSAMSDVPEVVRSMKFFPRY